MPRLTSTLACFISGSGGGVSGSVDSSRSCGILPTDSNPFPLALSGHAAQTRIQKRDSRYLETRVKLVRKPNLQTGNIDVEFLINESEKFQVESIKIEANKRDVPYQSLIKMTLADQFQQHPSGS